MQVQPHLDFNGRCEEALEFYRTALGAEVMMLARFKDMPAGQPAMVAPENVDKIMHARLRIGDSVLLASDGHCQGKPTFQGTSLSIIVSNKSEGERAFNALAKGGEVRMPLVETFFSPCFGMLTDRFGLVWMVYMPPASEQA